MSLVKLTRTRSHRERWQHARSIERCGSRKMSSIHTRKGSPLAGNIRELALEICYRTAEIGGFISRVSRQGTIYVGFADRNAGMIRVGDHPGYASQRLCGQVLVNHQGDPFVHELDDGSFVQTFGPDHLDELVAGLLNPLDEVQHG